MSVVSAAHCLACLHLVIDKKLHAHLIQLESTSSVPEGGLTIHCTPSNRVTADCLITPGSRCYCCGAHQAHVQDHVMMMLVLNSASFDFRRSQAKAASHFL